MTDKSNQRIQQAFENKDWPEIKSSDSWNIFKVMSEFVEGYDTLSRIGPCVSVFGSARTKPGTPYYEMAVE
ncbi:TIGR00730 family Rossman fold protein, partial [Bacteroidia bacterium]|nr:TIGR00730 family Rossman fold protein [Bacteroidia bacterium]